MRDLKITLTTLAIIFVMIVGVSYFASTLANVDGFLIGVVLYLTVKREVQDFFERNQ